MEAVIYGEGSKMVPYLQANQPELLGCWQKHEVPRSERKDHLLLTALVAKSLALVP